MSLHNVVIGTRGSQLARAQTEQFAERLRQCFPDLVVETRLIRTTGDSVADRPLKEVGTKGMFVKEIEEALLQGAIDVGIHSLKDMPSELPDGLSLCCIPEREDPRDSLLTLEKLTLTDLKPGAVVGTSSPRRKAQISELRPDLNWRDIRGNLDTRIRKLEDGEFDAILLACAGLNRLGVGSSYSQPLDIENCVPAVGQGALAIETRTDRSELRELLSALNDPLTEYACKAERSFLRALDGGCTVPAGALAHCKEDLIRMVAVYANASSGKISKVHISGKAIDADEIGKRAAEDIIKLSNSSLTAENDVS